MAGKVFQGERSIVVSTVLEGMRSIEDLDAICESYGEAPFIGGFLLNTEVASAAGGLSSAMVSVNRRGRYNGAVGVYDRVQYLEDQMELPGHFARRMAETGVAGVMLHPTVDTMADAMFWDLERQGVGAIVDIGAPADAIRFDVGSTWENVVGVAHDRGVRAYLVPGNAAESVGKLNERLVREAGVGEFALIAACPDTPSLESMLYATGGNLHVIVPQDVIDSVPEAMPVQTLRYVNAQALLSMVVSQADGAF